MQGYRGNQVLEFTLSVTSEYETMNLQEAFQTEIEFWDTMLQCQTEETPEDILERIKMAKLLAEQKLSLYTADRDYWQSSKPHGEQMTIQ